ncbi:MAG: hypothetical protein IMZ64_00850, partial [Bacteroidetes bacterium]|nr:hypothetical protein [Bacteroidota bacterium]
TGTVVQFGDRRLRVTTQISSTEVRNIWGITKSIMQLIPSNISAYGFNYDLLLDLNLDYQTTDYRFLFPNDLPALEGIIASKIEKFTPRFSFKRDGGLIDITLEPINSSRTKVHGNMHFKSINLPVEEELGQSFTNQLAYLLDLSSQLFNQKS